MQDELELSALLERIEDLREEIAELVEERDDAVADAANAESELDRHSDLEDEGDDLKASLKRVQVAIADAKRDLDFWQKPVTSDDLANLLNMTEVVQ